MSNGRKRVSHTACAMSSGRTHVSHTVCAMSNGRSVCHIQPVSCLTDGRVCHMQPVSCLTGGRVGHLQPVMVNCFFLNSLTKNLLYSGVQKTTKIKLYFTHFFYILCFNIHEQYIQRPVITRFHFKNR